MIKIDITVLLEDLKKNKDRASALLSMIDSGFDIELIRAAIEELHSESESLKLGYSIYEKPFCNEKINQV